MTYGSIASDPVRNKAGIATTLAALLIDCSSAPALDSAGPAGAGGSGGADSSSHTSSVGSNSSTNTTSAAGVTSQTSGGTTSSGSTPLEEVHLIGRFDKSDPAGPKFAWPGSSMITR